LKPLIAPSILSANFACLGKDVEDVIGAGADIIHFDAMDNHFVSNLTIGPMVCEALRDFGITAPIDVHLMMQPIDSIIPAFIKAGASYISFHPEATNNVERTLDLIRENGCKCGLAFSPRASLDVLKHTIDKVDIILIMSVDPGFGGQGFISSSLAKLHQAKEIIQLSGRNIRLEIDGGVNVENIAEIAAAGADIFVAGSAIFGSEDYASTITSMRDLINNISRG
tara:strand:+ start:803 stop:1477 length:675 start_codon:yes stop_codon:yes gene_type:complete